MYHAPLTMDQAETVRGLKMADAAVHLEITRYRLNKGVGLLGINIHKFFKQAGNVKYHYEYFDDKRHLTPRQISDEFDIDLDVVRKAIIRVGLRDEFNMSKYEKGSEENDELLTVSVEFTCMRPGCNSTFSKDISKFVPERRRKTIPFLCSGCKTIAIE